MPSTELTRLLSPHDSYDARPVVAWLVRHAAIAGASDLHLRPTEDGVEVLLRHDGVLQLDFTIASNVYERLVVGLKNLARLASYKRSVPQDGQLTVDGQEVRVATAPTHFGEKVVLRLVRLEGQLRRLDELGFTAEEQARMTRMMDVPQGLVLATGPAGSGKTTTLFAAMQWLAERHQERVLPARDARLNIVTLEDPIEIVVPQFSQTQIQPAAGMTFASGLKSLLRQDPEVILVGEIRDGETAQAVVQCSLTGHLVLSTVHARDSVGVLPRLLELGVEPYLLSAAVTGVCYQRLLRRLCTDCRKPVAPPPELRDVEQVYEPVGCDACHGTGYRDRTGVPELLHVDEALRQGLLDRLPLAELRRRARDAGLEPLRQAALHRVASGDTSWSELTRVCPE